MRTGANPQVRPEGGGGVVSTPHRLDGEAESPQDAQHRGQKRVSHGPAVSLAAVPNRTRLLVTKAPVVGGVSLVVSLGGFLWGLPILALPLPPPWRCALLVMLPKLAGRPSPVAVPHPLCSWRLPAPWWAAQPCPSVRRRRSSPARCDPADPRGRVRSITAPSGLPARSQRVRTQLYSPTAALRRQHVGPLAVQAERVGQFGRDGFETPGAKPCPNEGRHWWFASMKASAW